MPDNIEDTKPHFYVQNRHSVQHGTGNYGAGMRRVTFGPGQQIPHGLLEPEEVERLMARGTIGLKPPVQLPPAPGSNPAGVGLQAGADAVRRF